MSKTNMTRISISTDLSHDIQNRITTLLDRKNGQWSGTMTDFNRAITTGLRRVEFNGWPKTTSVFRRVINTMVPSLRRLGVRVEFTRTTDHMRTRLVNLSYRNGR